MDLALLSECGTAFLSLIESTDTQRLCAEPIYPMKESAFSLSVVSSLPALLTGGFALLGFPFLVGSPFIIPAWKHRCEPERRMKGKATLC